MHAASLPGDEEIVNQAPIGAEGLGADPGP